jgi:tetratricopeptide (TPR) repeat protein
MMSFFAKLKAFFGVYKAASLHGVAAARFYQKRYNDAARLFEQICKLDPEHERIEVSFSYLGRCYLYLGRYDEAEDILSRAYELFRRRNQSPDGKFYRREYVSFLIAFSNVLKKNGQLDRALEIDREAEEHKIALTEEEKRKKRD